MHEGYVEHFVAIKHAFSIPLNRKGLRNKVETDEPCPAKHNIAKKRVFNFINE